MSERTAEGLAFEITGRGHPLLLIHAGIANRAMWEPQWLGWADEFTLIRYDQRGFGDSPDPNGPYYLHDDALSILDAAGARRAFVIGASMGGKAALDLALAAPERVRALVTVAATPSGWEHDPQLVAAFAAVDHAYERDGVDAANEAELSIWVDGPHRGSPAVDPAVRGLVGAMNRDALLREEAAAHAGVNAEPLPLEPPALGRLAEVAAPTLVVTGELDQPSVNAGSAAIAEGISGAVTAQISDAAHLPSLERPAAFADAVRSFLQSVD